MCFAVLFPLVGLSAPTVGDSLGKGFTDSFDINPQSQEHMKAAWFKRFGWFYLPVSVPGGAVSLLAILFCLIVFRAVDRHSHSASDTLYGVFPFFACTFLLLDWIGGRTSEKNV